MQINGGGERVARAGSDAGPGHEQGNVAEGFVDRHSGLAPDVLLTEKVTVVGAKDHHGVAPSVLAVELVEDAAEPLVDHGELGPVARADLAGLMLVDDAVA